MHNRFASEDLTQTASTGTCRRIAVIDVDSSTNIIDAISAVTLPTASQPLNTTGGNTGNQFGLQARSIDLVSKIGWHTMMVRRVRPHHHPFECCIISTILSTTSSWPP